MNKIVRRTLKGLLIVVIVLVVLLVGVIIFLGPIIKTATEKIGPKVLGVPVTVEKVSVNAFAGSFGLKNLRVGNPQGYSTNAAFALGELRVAINLGSLPGKGPIEVKEVTIRDPKVSYEVVSGLSNIDAMLKNVQGGKPAEAAKPEAKPDAKPEAQPAEKKEARKVIIDKFEFRNGEVSYSAAITLHKVITIPLPTITATDIGKDSGGTSMEQAISRMFSEVVSGVGKAVVSIAGGVTDGAKAGADAVKGAADKIKSLF